MAEAPQIDGQLIRFLRTNNDKAKLIPIGTALTELLHEQPRDSVPAAIGDFLILRALRESGGTVLPQGSWTVV